MRTYDGLNFKSKPEWLSNEHGFLLAEIRQIQKELKEIKRLLGTKPHPLSAVWREPKIDESDTTWRNQVSMPNTTEEANKWCCNTFYEAWKNRRTDGF